MTQQEDVRQTLTRYLAVSARHLHGLPSRTDPAVLAAELERLNAAVRANAGQPSPASQPADFPCVLLQERDRCDAAQPQGSPAPATDAAKPAAGYLTLAQAARKMARGEVTSEQLTAQAIARATACQPTLNAFIEIWADRAMAQARAADAERAHGKARGPLHGIPLAHKDCFDIQGHAATVGSKARPAVQAAHDAHVIRLLGDAGAVTVGTLNMSEMVAGPTGQNAIFGDCCNALDPARIAGGSSSGSGAAVAAGAVFGSIGSDTGGSVRLPASVHGLFGLKPTYGRISRHGCFPRAFSLDCAGPLARTAQDCAILLQAVAGRDPQDPTSLDAPVPHYAGLLDTAAEKSRVAVLRPARPEDACAPEIACVFNAFATRVERLFGAVGEAFFSQGPACFTLSDIVAKAEASTLHGQWMRANPQAYSQTVYTRTEPGLHIPAVRYLEALVARARVLREFLAGPMADADILLLPTLPIPVPLRADTDMETGGSAFTFQTVAQITRLTRPFNYLGLPVLTMPMGLDGHGMPAGVQLIGRPLAEARLLSFAHQMSLAAP